MPRTSLNITVLILLWVMLAGSTLTGCGNKEARISKAQLSYDIAYDKLQRGELGPAIKNIQEAIELDPTNPDYHNLLGLMYFNRGMFPEAEDSFRSALKYKPKGSDIRNNLCGLYLTQTLWDRAIEECNKAVEDITYATPEKAYLNMGWAQYKKGDRMAAVTSFKKALAHRPGFYLAHQHLGTVYFDMGKYKLATQNFTKAIEGCKFCAEPYYRLGLTLFKVNRKKHAMRSFKKCTSLDKEGEIGRLCDNFVKKYKY